MRNSRTKHLRLPKSHWSISLQCISTVAFLVFLLTLIWKFESINLFTGRSEFFESSKPHPNGTAIKEEDLVGSYIIVETVNPAFAWQPVVLYLSPKSSSNLKVGRSTFWGRAKSDLEIISLKIGHVGNDVYKAVFLPSFGGLYMVDIYLTYVNGEQFEYARHVKARMVNLTGSPFFLVVQGRTPPGNITRYCTQAESGTALGRWVKCGALWGIERCSGWQLNTNFDFDKLHWYFWLPYTCQLHHYKDDEMKMCLAKNGWEKIVFTGDSHSRFRAYHWATRLYGACPNCGKNHVKTVFDHVPKMEWVFDARGTRWPATFSKFVKQPNEIYINPSTLRSHFSYPFPNSTLEGDLYFMNFGHWLLREMTFKKFMSEKIVAFLRGIKYLNRTRTVSGSRRGNAQRAESMNQKLGVKNSELERQRRFLWVNSGSLKWREDQAVVDWTMTPAPSTIGYLNALLDRAMKGASIQIVDAFQISNPRLDAIHDGTHFAKLFSNGVCAGTVENAVTNVILNALCNKS